MKMKWMNVVGMAAVALCGCGGPNPERAKLSVLQREVFTPSCATSSCHDAAEPAEGLDLSEGNARASLVEVDSHLQPGSKRVVPGDAERSVLYQAVSGTGTDVPRMPVGKKLSDEDIATIKLWIDNGAQDD